MRLLLLVAALFSALPAVAQEGTGRIITKSEIRSADPRRTHGRLRDVIWDMFERQDQRSERAPLHPLRNIWLQTLPRGTEIPGLCRYDSVQIEMAPTSRRSRGADTPVRAIGLSARAYYRFMRPPSQLANGAADYERSPLEGECRTLDTEAGNYFTAPSAATANDGYLAFLRLQEALRQAPSLPLDCNLFPADNQSCRDLILSFNAENIQELEDCEDPDSLHLCRRVRIDDRQIDIRVTRIVSPGPPPGQVVGARLTSLIVLWHTRAD